MVLLYFHKASAFTVLRPFAVVQFVQFLVEVLRFSLPENQEAATVRAVCRATLSPLGRVREFKRLLAIWAGYLINFFIHLIAPVRATFILL